MSKLNWLELEFEALADEEVAFRALLLRRAGGGTMVGFCCGPAAEELVLFLDFDVRLFIMEIYEKW